MLIEQLGNVRLLTLSKVEHPFFMAQNDNTSTVVWGKQRATLARYCRQNARQHMRDSTRHTKHANRLTSVFFRSLLHRRGFVCASAVRTVGETWSAYTQHEQHTRQLMYTRTHRNPHTNRKRKWQRETVRLSLIVFLHIRAPTLMLSWARDNNIEVHNLDARVSQTYQHDLDGRRSDLSAGVQLLLCHDCAPEIRLHERCQTAHRVQTLVKRTCEVATIRYAVLFVSTWLLNRFRTRFWKLTLSYYHRILWQQTRVIMLEFVMEHIEIENGLSRNILNGNERMVVERAQHGIRFWNLEKAVMTTCKLIE